MLLALTVAALVALMRWYAATPFAIWAAVLAFLASAPASESYYTLSKGEPVMLLCILGSLLATHRVIRSRHAILYWILGPVFMACAEATREPALATVGAVGGWWLLSFWRGFGKPVFLPRRKLGAFAAACAGAAGVVWIWRWLLHQPIAPGSYASGYHLTGARLLQNLFGLSFLAVRDFPVLCLLLAAAAALACGGAACASGNCCS